jgi:hypothetical protein
MIRLFAAMAALILPLLGGACGTDYATIRVSAQSRQAITEAAPPSEYSFLVSADSAPNDIADLNERDLLVCGMLGQREMLQLMTAPASQGTLLFRSVKHWYIDPSMDSGETHTSEEMTMMFPTGGEAVLPIEKYVHGRDAIGEPLLASCMENMEERDVFLLDKDLGVSEPETLVLLVFR